MRKLCPFLHRTDPEKPSLVLGWLLIAVGNQIVEAHATRGSLESTTKYYCFGPFLTCSAAAQGSFLDLPDPLHTTLCSLQTVHDCGGPKSQMGRWLIYTHFANVSQKRKRCIKALKLVSHSCVEKEKGELGTFSYPGGILCTTLSTSIIPNSANNPSTFGSQSAREVSLV